MAKEIKHPGWTTKEWNETKKVLDTMLINYYNKNKKER